MVIVRKRRRIMVMALLGVAMAAAGVIVAQLGILNVEPHFAVLPGGAIFLLEMLYANLFAFRCTQCSGNLAALVMQYPWLWFRFCPFCGLALDEQLPADVSVKSTADAVWGSTADESRDPGC
jgi:hypothetical protein